MLTAQDVTIQIGARTLMENVSFRIQKGDKIGLVGRNGAGKTTLTKTLAGETLPTSGKIEGNGAAERAKNRLADAQKALGYLPQDTQVGDVDQLAIDRILEARGLDRLKKDLDAVMTRMSSSDPAIMERAMGEYDKINAQFEAAGGYGATSDAEAIASSLKIPLDTLNRALSTLSGGQRRRIELARILFAGSDTMLLDEPTNHLDADSIVWLRSFLQDYEGGFLIITHDVELLEAVCNKVFFLDGNRQQIDQYNMGWKKYLKQREVDEERRRRERQIALEESDRLFKQGNKMRASATKAVAARQMLKRAAELKEQAAANAETVERVAALRFPTPEPCGKTPLMATGLSKSYGSSEVWAGVSLAIDKGSKVVVLGLNGAGKSTLLKILAGVETSDTGSIEFGHGAKLGYYAQEHDTIDGDKTVLENMVRAAPPKMDDTAVRSVLGSFMFQGDDVLKPARVLSGGEKTRLALATLVVSGANVLLLDEPTNNLDPASREEVLGAIANFEGATVLVTHDPGATRALEPDRVLILPDADEDLWNESYQQIVELS